MKKIFVLPVILLLLVLSCTSSDKQIVVQPRKGSFVLVGGGNYDKSIRKKFIELADFGKIIVIPTGSERKEASKELYDSWADDHTNIVCLNALTRQEANSETFCESLREAKGVWFSGGCQEKLVTIYGDTLFEQGVQSIINRGGVVGGTSAGASAMSKKMISGGKIKPGFGFITNAIIDQHFNNRGRLSRLVNVVKENPEQLGIGIDESTSIIIRNGEIEIMGTGKVTLCRYKKSPSVVVYSDKNHISNVMIAMR
jgi:cyanophycinase